MGIVEQGFRTLASVRRARAFHPTGALYVGTAELTGSGPLPTGTRDVLVRLSKGAGLPAGLPDFLGLAFRVQDPTSPIDVLCTTTLGTRRWSRLVLAPARSWSGAVFSTLMPWERQSMDSVKRVFVTATVHTEGVDSNSPTDVGDHLPFQVKLQVVDSADTVLQEGSLVLTAPAIVDAASVALDPMRQRPRGWHVGPAWLARVREAAYTGSRHGRP